MEKVLGLGRETFDHQRDMVATGETPSRTGTGACSHHIDWPDGDGGGVPVGRHGGRPLRRRLAANTDFDA